MKTSLPVISRLLRVLRVVLLELEAAAEEEAAWKGGAGCPCVRSVGGL